MFVSQPVTAERKCTITETCRVGVSASCRECQCASVDGKHPPPQAPVPCGQGLQLLTSHKTRLSSVAVVLIQTI